MKKRIETTEGPLLATDVTNEHGSLYLTCFLNEEITDEECEALLQYVHEMALKFKTGTAKS